MCIRDRITPFQASGSIDYAAFARQMDRQLESGVDALCVCGTTGESSTLTVPVSYTHLVTTKEVISMSLLQEMFPLLIPIFVLDVILAVAAVDVYKRQSLGIPVLSLSELQEKLQA